MTDKRNIIRVLGRWFYIFFMGFAVLWWFSAVLWFGISFFSPDGKYGSVPIWSFAFGILVVGLIIFGIGRLVLRLTNGTGYTFLGLPK